MAYEWDARKARKNYLIRMVAIGLATCVLAAIPLIIIADISDFQGF